MLQYANKKTKILHFMKQLICEIQDKDEQDTQNQEKGKQTYEFTSFVFIFTFTKCTTESEAISRITETLVTNGFQTCDIAIAEPVELGLSKHIKRGTYIDCHWVVVAKALFALGHMLLAPQEVPFVFHFFFLWNHEVETQVC